MENEELEQRLKNINDAIVNSFGHGLDDFLLRNVLSENKDSLAKEMVFFVWKTLYIILKDKYPSLSQEAENIIFNWKDENEYYSRFNFNLICDEHRVYDALFYLYEVFCKVLILTERIDSFAYNDYFNDSLLDALNTLSPNKANNFKAVKEKTALSVILNFSRSEDFNNIKKAIERQRDSNNALAVKTELVEKGIRNATQLKKYIDDKSVKLNNILLSESFQYMLGVKVRERFFSSVIYFLLMLVCFSIPLMVIYYHDFIIGDIISERSGVAYLDWIKLSLYSFPVVFLEVISLYFTRLSYVELKNIKAQIVQVNLRLSACMFIKDYVRQKQRVYNYAIFGVEDDHEMLRSFLKEKTSEGRVNDIALVKFPEEFEKLIFSPIQTSGDNIPSALDGVNSIAELAGKIMSAKK
ncbi:hypothetical protein H5A35_07095 [Pectobacterium brasiliense]|uniref:hypothetical protein n=1 Tax=Pectobacterium brasiliense TaxID=180957 RepID=UPI0019694395|nr:hypothetical protein [Pectobacterium brasiliense]MBN3207178.1 hypothetical protein [Pectobacterium brasiliense]